MITKQFNDSLDNLFDGDKTVDGGARVQPAPQYVAMKEAGYFEKCGKCRGTGMTPWGACFRCSGKGGKTFKTSAESRARSRTAAVASNARKEQEAIEVFKAAEPAVYAWIEESAPSFGFAASMQEALRRWGGLTDGQVNACKNAISKRDAARAARSAEAASAPAVDTAGVDRLKAAFDTAIAKAQAKGRGFKNPRITIGGMVISPAKASSSNAGALYVKQGSEYLGKVMNGHFRAVQACTPAQEKQVLAFIADPKAAAIAYGKETGVCCICNATLTNKVSIEAGIGPICSSKFGW